MWTKKGKRTHQTRPIDPMLAQCWATLYDVSPALVQHWFDVSFVTDIDSWKAMEIRSYRDQVVSSSIIINFVNYSHDASDKLLRKVSAGI